MDRRDLLTIGTQGKKHQDFSNTARTQSGLLPYTGPWTLDEVNHMLRRLMFGATKVDADHFLSTGMAAAITELLTPPATAPDPPVWTYSANYNDPNVPQGQTWVNAPYDNQANNLRNRSFKAWWVSLMLNQPRNASEKMTLFWCNHFSTETATV